MPFFGLTSVAVLQTGQGGGAVCWGTAKQAGRLSVRSPMKPGRNMTLGSTHPLTEMSTKNTSRGTKLSVGMADSPTNCMCRLYGNVGTSVCWNHWSLCSSVQGLIYRYYGLVRRSRNGNLTTCVVTWAVKGTHGGAGMPWVGFETEYLYLVNQRLCHPTVSFFTTVVLWSRL